MSNAPSKSGLLLRETVDNQPRDGTEVSWRGRSPAVVEGSEYRDSPLLGGDASFRLMVEAVTDYAFFMLDPEGIVSTWNPGAARIKGYTADEIVGRHFSVFYPRQALERGLPGHELIVAARDGQYKEEGWRVRKDGSQFWANVGITAMRSQDGSLVGFAKVTRDLTERLASEAAIRESNLRKLQVGAELASANHYLRHFNAATQIAIISTELNGVIAVFNRGAERMLGYRADEVIGRETPALFHDPAEMETRGERLSELAGRPLQGFEIFTAGIGGEGHSRSEWTYVHRDGHTLDVALSLSAIQGDDGQTIGYLGVAEDVTERQRAARETARVYSRLNAVMDSTSDGILQLCHDWTILYGNRKAMETLPDFHVGRSLWECFPALVDTPVEASMRRTMEERVPSVWENHYAPYDLWYRSRGFPTEDGISIFYTDITAEKTMQNQLSLEQILREKRIEALSHMAGGLAHEINNPLAIIHARASDLKASVVDDAPVPAADVLAACGSIVHTADRAIRVLRALQGFAREAGADPMHTVSAYDVLDQCVEMLEARFQRHNVELKVEMEPGIPLLRCRETQIRQIVSNLLNNALDAIDEAGIEPRVGGAEQERWVALRAHCGEGLLHIDVMDSGPGIEDQFRAHLMDPFFTTKVRGLGMGVGLSLSRTIAQEHGGSLALMDATETCAATCFRLTLPLVKEES